MSTTVTIKLNKPAHQFQAGESLGFGIRGGVQYYDRETRQKEWTNYEAVVFSKNQNQIEFLQSSLIPGAIVEVTAKSQKIKSFDGQNGQLLSIELLDASLGMIHNPQDQQQPQQHQRAPQQYQQPQQQAPRQQQQAPHQGQHYHNQAPQQPQQQYQQTPQQHQQAPQRQSRAEYSGQQAPQQGQPNPAANEFEDDIPF